MDIKFAEDRRRGDGYMFCENEILGDGFVVDSDIKAEWVLRKIKEIENEYGRFDSVCQSQIDFYKEKAENAKNRMDNDRAKLVSMLQGYFLGVASKATKTQATYKLPSGKLVMKFEKPEMTHDEGKLANRLAGTAYVTLMPKLAWGEYKKTLSIVGGKAVDADGEVIEEITVAMKPAVFTVEV